MDGDEGFLILMGGLMLVLIFLVVVALSNNDEKTGPICGWNAVSAKGDDYWEPVHCDHPGEVPPSVSPELYGTG